ncbi:MAG: hypothetical protein J6A88_10145 [Oscillospiraceae bacterium]|nr:hypothetical protein [Oscillospiraceae bacterium]
MEGTYPILFGDKNIGQAQVTRRGLYYHFSCRMQLTGETICRLELCGGDRTENLGIPVPEGKSFVLTKTIPASRLDIGKPTFRLIPKHQSVQGKFIPLSPEEPFAYLSRLKDAYLQRRGEQIGIVIKE